MADATQTDGTAILFIVPVSPTCNMCGLPKSGNLCSHCDQPCHRWRTCVACKVGYQFDGIGPKTGPWLG